MSYEGPAGGCPCHAVRYRLIDRPLFVHACHCTWCQRETGSAFALNAIIEARLVEVDGETIAVNTPSASGQGQIIHRCPKCQVALWSIYSGFGPRFLFMRAGAFDNPVAPDIHIFTGTKAPWLSLDDGVPVVTEYYRRSLYWPEWAQKRREAELARTD